MNTFVHGDDDNKVVREDVQLLWTHNNVRRLCKKRPSCYILHQLDTLVAEQSKSW